MCTWYNTFGATSGHMRWMPGWKCCWECGINSQNVRKIRIYTPWNIYLEIPSIPNILAPIHRDAMIIKSACMHKRTTTKYMDDVLELNQQKPQVFLHQWLINSQPPAIKSGSDRISKLASNGIDNRCAYTWKSPRGISYFSIHRGKPNPSP